MVSVAKKTLKREENLGGVLWDVQLQGANLSQST